MSDESCPDPRLISLQSELRSDHGSLVERFDNSEIDMEEYKNLTIEFMRFYLAEARELIGESDFYRIFGEAGYHPEGLFGDE